MEEILKQILAELQHHTKLMEEVFLNKDEKKFNAAQMKMNMKNVMANMSEHPVFKQNPGMADATIQMVNTILGGIK